MYSTEFANKIVGMRKDILNFAFKLTMDYDDANDLAQDAICKALDSESKYKDQSSFRSWLFTITKNIFINNYRLKVRRGTINDSTDDLLLLNSKETDLNNPEEDLSVKEITDFLNNINETYKTPFKMYIEGYKYSDIVDELNLPLGTVKSRIHFARKILQTHFKDYRYK